MQDRKGLRRALRTPSFNPRSGQTITPLKPPVAPREVTTSSETEEQVQASTSSGSSPRLSVKQELELLRERQNLLQEQQRAATEHSRLAVEKQRVFIEHQRAAEEEQRVEREKQRTLLHRIRLAEIAQETTSSEHSTVSEGEEE